MSKKPNQPDQLRTKAEAQLTRTPAADVLSHPAVLQHELSVHQIGLEMQNKALRQAQITLQEFHDRYVDMYDFTPVAYLTLTREALIAEANFTSAALLGVERKKLLHRPFAQLVAPEDNDLWHQYFMRVMQQEEQQGCELALRRGNGSLFYARLECLVETGSGGYSALVALTDITERKRAETVLRESEQHYQQIIQTSMDGFLIADSAGRFLDVNAAYCQMIGYTRRELLNMCITDVEAKESPEETAQHIREIMAKGSVRFETRHRRKDGQLMDIEVSAVLQVGKKRFIFVFLRDITRHKITTQRIRELTEHLQTVREEEKANLAREIHDDLSGTLTAIKMDVYRLKSKLPEKEETKQIFDRIKSMSQLLDGAVITLRNIITSLRPTILDDLGLLAALEWQAAQFRERTGIECRVNCVEDRGNIDKRQSIALFRIFQEALTNIARHSGASRVGVEFHHGEEGITLFIGDNGRGMTQQHGTAPGSYGLLGMTERVEQLGGKIKFDSPPGGGFNVTVRLPLQAGLQDGEKT